MVLKWPQLYSLLNEWKFFYNVEGGDLLCNKQLVTFLVCVDPNILGPYQFIVQNLSDSFERDRERRERAGERSVECKRGRERDGGKKERGRGEVKRYRGRDFREKDRDSNKKELAVVFCMNMM